VEASRLCAQHAGDQHDPGLGSTKTRGPVKAEIPRLARPAGLHSETTDRQTVSASRPLGAIATRRYTFQSPMRQVHFPVAGMACVGDDRLSNRLLCHMLVTAPWLPAAGQEPADPWGVRPAGAESAAVGERLIPILSEKASHQRSLKRRATVLPLIAGVNGFSGSAVSASSYVCGEPELNQARSRFGAIGGSDSRVFPAR